MKVRYLIFLLLFVLADVIGTNYILKCFNNQSTLYQFWISISLLSLQILASPIQTGFSDFYCRKKTLLMALCCSLISIILVYFYSQTKSPSILFPISIIGIKGCLGNIIPLSWATIADIQERNPRFSFGLATAGYAGGYLLLVASNRFLLNQQFHLSVISMFVILTFLCAVGLKDTRDGTNIEKRKGKPFFSLVQNDNRLIIDDLKTKYLRKILFAFLLWEISLYTILLLYIDFSASKFSVLPVGMMVGYLFGIFVLKFCNKISDIKMIKLGYYFSILSLIPIFITFPFVKEIDNYLLTFCYFFHSMGNAFLCPTLFTIISRVSPSHNWGRKYGLVESSDSIAFLCAFIILLIQQALNFSINLIIAVSFLSMLLSLLPYWEFLKAAPKKIR
jgi:MFS family permease